MTRRRSSPRSTISRLWGVGEKSAVALREYGVRTIGDLAALPDDLLVRRFGKHGASLAQRARGVDDDPVGDRDAAKSIGHEHTFDVDTSDREQIERTLLAMSEGVAGRLRDSGVKASTITVKIRDTTFRTITRQRTLPDPTDLTEPIFRTALELARPEVRGLRIRLLGVTASGLGEREQLVALRGRRPPPAEGDRGRRRRPPPLRRAGDHPGAAGRRAAAGAVRARPDDPGRPADRSTATADDENPADPLDDGIDQIEPID